MTRNNATLPRNFLRIMGLGTVFFLVLLSLSCSNAINGTAGPGGSGTGVGSGLITGVVTHSDGSPAAGALVRLRPETYLADTSGLPSILRNDTMATVETDSAGNFHIPSIDTSRSYCIEILGASALSHPNEATLFKMHFIDSSHVQLPTRTLSPRTVVTGAVKLGGLPCNAWIQIYGLDILTKTDSTGHFTIPGLPTGQRNEGECEFKLRALIPRTGGGYDIKEYELELETGEIGGEVSVEIDD